MLSVTAAKAAQTGQARGPASSKRRPWARRLALGAAGACVALVAAELGVRWGGPLAPEPLRSVIHEAKAARWNRDRVRGQVAIALPETRNADIVAVGDSFMFGMNVPASEAFPARLADATGRDVVNLGVIGMAPWEYNRLLDAGMRFEPELIVYGVYANDFGTTPAPDAAGQAPVSGFADEDLFLESAAAEALGGPRRALLDRSLLLSVRRQMSHPTLQSARYPRALNGDYFMLLGRAYWGRGLAWRTPGAEEAVENVAAAIEAARDRAARGGARLLVVLIPTKEMVYGPDVGLEAELGWRAHEETYQALAARLKNLGVQTLDLTSGLRERARPGAPLYFAIDAHFTPAGHAAASALAAERLRSGN